MQTGLQEIRCTQNALLTVVIPAYNVEQYIAKCLDSLLPQCPQYGVEVVIVVDGATDGTRSEIDKAISETNSTRVRVVEQHNQGLSAARNRGLREVQSEYVYFLDSDDYLADNFLDEVFPILVQERPDIVEFDATRVDEKGVPIGPLKITPVQDGQVRKVSQEEFLSTFMCYAWGRIVRTKIAARHRFPEGRRFEDAATIPWYYHDSSKIIGIGKPLVAYRQRRGSILASPRLSDVLDLAHAVDKAAREFRVKSEAFWQVVAIRAHQTACGRILLLTPHHWKTGLGALTDAIVGVPPTRGTLRWLQVRATRIYVLLLTLKRLVTIDSVESASKLFRSSSI